MPFLFKLLHLTLALALAFCLGCGDGSNRQQVAGKVIFQGKPLLHGQIEFQPTGKEGTAAGAPIRDGQYSIPAAKGLAPGTYQVRISSFGDQPPTGGGDAPPGDRGPPPKNRIPEKYNSKTSLTREIKKGLTEPLDFTLD